MLAVAVESDAIKAEHVVANAAHGEREERRESERCVRKEENDGQNPLIY